MPTNESAQMPDEVRHAFLQILFHTLLYIRSTKKGELSFALSDHAHNIPGLIEHYKPETFRYYWEVERPCFLRAMERLGEKFGVFQEHWTVLERHYEGLPQERLA
jgi:hypothetical protein